MSKKNKKQNLKFSIIFSRHAGLWTVLVIIMILVTIFLFADRGTLMFYKSYSEKELLEQEIEELESKKEKLLKEKDKLENDPEYIEKVAREKYRMKKKDEKVYQVEMEKDK